MCSYKWFLFLIMILIKSDINSQTCLIGDKIILDNISKRFDQNEIKAQCFYLKSAQRLQNLTSFLIKNQPKIVVVFSPSILNSSKLLPQNIVNECEKCGVIKLIFVVNSVSEKHFRSTSLKCNLCLVNNNIFIPDYYNRNNALQNLIFKIYTANNLQKRVVDIWEKENTKINFLHINDLADAISLFIKKDISADFFYIDSSRFFTLKEVSSLIEERLGYDGRIEFDNTKPSLLNIGVTDTNLIRDIGWSEEVDINTCINEFIDNFFIKDR